MFHKLFLINQALQAGLRGPTMTIVRQRVVEVPKKEIEHVCRPIALTGQTALESLLVRKTATPSAVQVYTDRSMFRLRLNNFQNNFSNLSVLCIFSKTRVCLY